MKKTEVVRFHELFKGIKMFHCKLCANKKKKNNNKTDSFKSEIQTVFPKAKIKSIYAVNADDSFRLSVLYGYGLPGCIIHFIHFLLTFSRWKICAFFSLLKRCCLVLFWGKNGYVFGISIIWPAFMVFAEQKRLYIYLHISRCSLVVWENIYFGIFKDVAILLDSK